MEGFPPAQWVGHYYYVEYYYDQLDLYYRDQPDAPDLWNFPAFH